MKKIAAWAANESFVDYLWFSIKTFLQHNAEDGWTILVGDLGLSEHKKSQLRELGAEVVGPYRADVASLPCLTCVLALF